MSQATALINTKLIESLAQIILSLTEEERQALSQKIQHTALLNEEIKRQRKALICDINLGIEQLKNSDYTEYDDSSLPALLETIKMRGKQRLQQELS
jgi:spore germination protein YaaH